MKTLGLNIIVMLVILFLTSCSGNTTERRIGILVNAFESVETFDAPEDVVAGQAFDVTFISLGGFCMEEDSVEVIYEDGGVTLTPYDLHPADDNTTCPATAKYFTRRASVTFGGAGEYTIAVRGRSVDDLYDRDEDLVLLQETVQVSE